MFLIGLTGGIASGKSTVSAMLADHGAIVIDADDLARDAVAPGSAGLAAVIDRFGESVLTTDGGLDRAALAARIFQDERARGDLEGIVHPEVAAQFERLLGQLPPDSVVVYDVPLLVENSMADRFDLVVVTEASQAERVRRAVVNRGMTRDQVLRRIAAQASDDQRRAVADVVIDTDRELGQVRDAVARLWRDRVKPERTGRHHAGT